MLFCERIQIAHNKIIYTMNFESITEIELTEELVLSADALEASENDAEVTTHDDEESHDDEEHEG